MKFVAICSWLLLFPFLVLGYPLTPDNDKTPGHLCSTSNRDFSGYRYQEKIVYCQRNVSSAMKQAVYESYGIPKAERNQYTIDHFYPLSMGGSNERANLWPEHKNVKATRPNLELELFEDLAAGKMTQKEVLSVILEEKTRPRDEE